MKEIACNKEPTQKEDGSLLIEISLILIPLNGSFFNSPEDCDEMRRQCCMHGFESKRRNSG